MLAIPSISQSIVMVLRLFPCHTANERLRRIRQPGRNPTAAVHVPERRDDYVRNVSKVRVLNSLKTHADPRDLHADIYSFGYRHSGSRCPVPRNPHHATPSLTRRWLNDLTPTILRKHVPLNLERWQGSGVVATACSGIAGCCEILRRCAGTRGTSSVSTLANNGNDPGNEVVPVTPGTVERTTFPPKRIDKGMAGVGVEGPIQV
jgi:hypothetical protein